MLGHIPPHLTSSYRLRKSLNHYKCMKKQRYYNGIVDIFNYSGGSFLPAKFVTLFFLVLFLAIAPATASPLQEIRITIQRTNVPLGEIFKEIEQKTDYSFLIRRNDVDTNRKVSLNAQNKSVAEILGMLFDNQGIDYKVDGKRISVYKAIDKEGQPRKVTGRVVDASREPVIGASVVIEGTSMGTITDIDGNFSLEVSDDNVMLTISYIGYKTHNVRVQGKNNINVVLQEDSKALDEVVVVGYGTQKKVNLTGSVETVKSDKIAGKPVTSLQEALTGEAAGMTITQTSGQPGRNSTSVRIRGVGTWGDADPLVLVDGVAMNMEDVMPSDVESISVLKDAASAAIYGSRAANGVILITTKQGKKGKVSINYSGNVGIQRATRVPKMAKSWQYAELYNQSMENEGKSSTLFPQDRIDRMKAGGDPDVLEGSTDWFDEILHPAVQHSHNVTVQGGGEKTSYIGSLGYTYQNGVIFSSYKRYNARINTTTDLTSWFKIGMNLAYINDISSESAAGATAAYYKVPRALPYMPVKFSDGTWSFHSTPTNPVRMASDDYGMHYNKGSKISMLLTPELNLLDCLNIKGIFGYESNTYNDKTFQKTVLYDAFEPAGQASNQFVARNKQTDKWEQYNNMTASVTATFDKTFGKHALTVLAGASAETHKYKYTTGSRQDFPNNDFSEINAGDPNTSYAEGNSTYSSLASLFGRVNYVFADRYLFEANVRYDGSSKFARGHRWGVFPSFSLGWRISEEKFFENLKEYIPNLKLRASWGQLGNQEIDNYLSVSTYGAGNAWMFGNSIASGYTETVMGNPLITWETATNWNVGLDFSLFDNRLSASFDWYKKITDDILLSLEEPATLGIVPSMQNAGSMENKGWEITLNWRDQIGEDFSYSIGFNLSDVKNKVTDLNGYQSPSSSLTARIEGQPLDALFGWETIGICQNEEQYNQYKDLMQTYNPNWGIGDLIIKDRKKDGVINSEDKTVIGNQIPRFTYGINLGLTWKNLDFSCFLQGVGKRDGFLGRDIIEPLGVMSALEEHYTDSFNPKNPNPDAYYPRILSSWRHNYDNFSHWVQNASYLRLKNLQIGYTFSFPKAKIEKLRLTLSGQNLLTFTKYRVFDPESALNNVSFPNVAVYSFGVNMTL